MQWLLLVCHNLCATQCDQQMMGGNAGTGRLNVTHSSVLKYPLKVYMSLAGFWTFRITNFFPTLVDAPHCTEKRLGVLERRR